jgi:amphi-Trp domain-containing protein
MPRRRDRDLERTYSRTQFVAKLRRLADALESGSSFRIQVAGERIRVPARAEFSVEHERSADEEEVEFQLKWRPGEVPGAGEDEPLV